MIRVKDVDSELPKLRGNVKRNGNKGIRRVNRERVAQWTHILPPAKLDLHRQTLRPPPVSTYAMCLVHTFPRDELEAKTKAHQKRLSSRIGSNVSQLGIIKKKRL